MSPEGEGIETVFIPDSSWVTAGDLRAGLVVLALVLVVAWFRGDHRWRMALLLSLGAVVITEGLWQAGMVWWRGGEFRPSLHLGNVVAFGGSLALAAPRFRRLLGGAALGALVAALYLRVGLGYHTLVEAGAGILLGLASSGILLGLWRAFDYPLGVSPRINRRNWAGLAVLFVLIMAGWRLDVIADQNNLLLAEEAQYWDWSRHLDWSYYSKPPLTTYTILVTTWLMGTHELGVRLGAWIISFAVALLGWRLSRDLGYSPRAAFAALTMLALMPLYGAGSVTMTTDTPLLFFWALACWSLWRAVHHGHLGWWLLTGMALGLGMLSKYTMAFFLLSAVVFLALAPTHRHWLTRWQPLTALVLGLALFTPVIYWNWKNDWVTFKHVAADAGVQHGFQLRPDEFASFLVVQSLIVSPAMAALLVAAMVSLFLRSFQVRGSSRRGLRQRELFLICLALGVFGAYGAKALQDKVQANWAALSYYSWVILAAGWLDTRARLWRRGPQGPTRAKIVLGTVLALAFLMTFGLKHPDSLGDFGNRFQPAARIGDWRRLARDMDRMLQEMPQPDRTFILAREYQTAALIAFYMKDRPRVYLAPDSGRRMNQYDLWPSFRERECWDALFVRIGPVFVLSGRIARYFEGYGEPFHRVVGTQRGMPRTYTILPAFGLRGELVPDERPGTY